MARRTVSVPVPSASALCMVALLAVGSLVIGGGLNPPAGPVAPTMKSLDEVEPRIPINAVNTPGDADSLYKITAPGSYYLTGNVTGVVGKHGIEIASGGVTIDLNGFDLQGIAGMGAFDGITVTPANLPNITVRNGSVRDWGSDGINLAAANATGARLERIAASGNAAIGLWAGPSSVVVECTAFDNSIGIATDHNCTVINSTAIENTNDGFNIGLGNTLENCTANGNADHGFLIGTGAVIRGCAATTNVSDGFNIGTASSILDCVAYNNGVNGIQTLGDCLIRGNTCDNNDGGIRVAGADTIVDGNNCTDNTFGLLIVAGGNLIIRNTCSGNTTNWSITPNNAVAPIVMASTNAAMITGNTYAGSLGSTDPNANFTY